MRVEWFQSNRDNSSYSSQAMVYAHYAKDPTKPGEGIECTTEKLGTLTNTLGQRPERFYEPLRDSR